jgi:hypothetical protein
VARRALTCAAIATLLVGPAPSLCAQGLELSPYVGYRAGDVFDISVPAYSFADVDRAPAVGLVLDVPLWEGLQVEGMFSHQSVSILAYPDSFSPPARLHGAVDHWEGGALQELGRYHAVRPFLTGVLGLTRYAIEADNEVRFTLGAGGGVKLFPVKHVGVRLDGRVFATFLDAETTAGVCGSGACLLGLHVNVAWQVEFSAGVVVRLGPGA